MKNIVITGASKGIGFETALRLLDLDNKVVAIARSIEKLNRLEEHPNSEFLTILPADLTDQEDLNKINEFFSTGDKIDALINNAGMVLNKPFMETSIQEWKDVFNINLFAPVELTKILKPYFKKGTHIVNIGSMGGFQSSDKFPGLSAYSTAKGALAILTESLSAEFSSDNISVNCLCLGAVQTEMLEKAFPGYKAPVEPEQMAEFISDFTLSAHQFMNGKIIPVSLNNPE